MDRTFNWVGSYYICSLGHLVDVIRPLVGVIMESVASIYTSSYILVLYASSGSQSRTGIVVSLISYYYYFHGIVEYIYIEGEIKDSIKYYRIDF